MLNELLKVSMVLIGYNKHEPNMLRWFWDVFFAGTMNSLKYKNPFSGFDIRGVTFHIRAK